MTDRVRETRRRFLLSASVGAVAWASTASAQEMARAPKIDFGPTFLSPEYRELMQIAEDAYIWGYPLVQIGEYFRFGQLYNEPINQMIVARDIALNTFAPNIELLYGMAYLDLRKEPLVVSVPDTNGRYYSLQFLDGFGNSFAYISKLTNNTKAGVYLLTGPTWRGKVPNGMTQIASPHDLILVQSRTFVGGAEDVAAANAIQDQYLLGPLSSYPHKLKGSVTQQHPLLAVVPMLRYESYGPAYFDILSERLAITPAPARDRDFVERLKKIGIAPGKRPSQTKDPQLLQALRDGIRRGEDRIAAADFTTRVNGWSVIYGVTSDIKDPVLRAFTNRLGSGFHTAEEGQYFIRMTGPDGKFLNGANKYRLRFAAHELPPVHAFWTLSLMTPDSYVAKNPSNRYSIAGHTEGLVYGKDGSLEIAIQHEQPPEGPANWLPAPKDGFRLTIRLYEPKQPSIDGTYKIPNLVMV